MRAGEIIERIRHMLKVKLDMEDAEGGDVLLANGSIVPLTMAGAAYLKGASEPDETEEPEQPEEKTEPDAEQPDTATEPVTQ